MICLALVFACAYGAGKAKKESHEISDQTGNTDNKTETDITDPSEETVWEKGQAGSLEEPTAGLASHIIVDAIGYSVEDEKTAYLDGGDPGAVFYVVREDDRSIVFEGNLEKINAQDAAGTSSMILSGDEICRANFTDLKKPGLYYIQTPVIGQSETFRISEDLYGEIADSYYDAWKEKSGLFEDGPALSYEAFEGGAKDLFLLSVCAGMHPSFWEKHKADLIAATNRLMESYHVKSWDAENGSGFNSGNAAYIAALAELSCTLRIYGEPEEKVEQFSGEAVMAYGAVNREGIGDGDYKESREQVFADAALLKLTGDDRFQAPVEEYLAGITTWDEENFPIIWCYLTTQKVTDLEICDRLMDLLLHKTGRIADAYHGKDDTTGSGETGEGGVEAEKTMGDAVFDMQLLSLADYVIVSREYRECCRQIYREQIAGGNPSAKEDAGIVFSLYHEE